MKTLLIKFLDGHVLYIPWPKDLEEPTKANNSVWNYLEEHYPGWREWKAEEDETDSPQN